MNSRFLSVVLTVCVAAPAAFAQASNVSAVAVNPANSNEVWVCNRDNDSISVIDVSTQTLLAEIPVGVKPRSLAFTTDGSKLYVVNQRGTIPEGTNFVVGQFDASQLRGSLSIVDPVARTVSSTLSDIGVEPYGVSVAPNGAYAVVSGFRSATMTFINTATDAKILTHDYPRSLNFIFGGNTRDTIDENFDGVADLDSPRGFSITSDSSSLWVTHFKSPYVSVLDVTLDGNGLPTAVALDTKINTDIYALDPILNPIPVQELKSQGKPRYLEDIALSPDGTRALVPHVLHNVNHDVNFDFTTIWADWPGDFANRVYPALSMLDVTQKSFDPVTGTDASNRLHNDLLDSRTPAATLPYGPTRVRASGAILTLGALSDPSPGTTFTVKVDGVENGDQVFFFWGSQEANMPFAAADGNLLCQPRRIIAMSPAGELTLRIPGNPGLDGLVVCGQALVQNMMTGESMLSNGIRLVYGENRNGLNKMGHRAGQPSRVAYSSSGEHALMLNRGSEDIFLYDVNGSDMELRQVFPPRHDFQERAALDTSTAMGDLPLGMAVWEDPTTPNDDALVYIVNETTTSLSTLRVNYTTGMIFQELPQITTIAGADKFTVSERLGQELFEDASRSQTTGHFNNSCASCHFEGGEDANVWQRPAGPRSTMPIYGGTLGTGLLLWKGSRLSMAEVGPMHGGENGGHGILTDVEQDALIDYHNTVPVPLNPNLIPTTGDYDPLAAIGKDLFFGTNDSGTNPMLREAGCVTCHPDAETGPNSPGPRFYTADFVDPLLSGKGEMFGIVDPGCFSLRQSAVAVNLRDVNTDVNSDTDGMPGADLDRNGDSRPDIESYVPMNVDSDDDFLRDDPNSYNCPCQSFEFNCDPVTLTRNFQRPPGDFSIPTKMGVFGTAPYFHDHSAYSLRAVVDPLMQQTDPIYGSATLPSLTKLLTGEHDVRGNEITFIDPITMLPTTKVSVVQQTLQSGTVAQTEMDIDAILSYIRSL